MKNMGKNEALESDTGVHSLLCHLNSCGFGASDLTSLRLSPHLGNEHDPITISSICFEAFITPLAQNKSLVLLVKHIAWAIILWSS